jgi:hypothetical protein
MTTSAWGPAFDSAFGGTGLPWLDPADVAAEVGIPVPDHRLLACCDASARQVELWRGDLDYTGDVRSTDPDVYQGAVMYAGLLWQSRNTPEGFAGFEDGGGIIGLDNAKMSMIHRLIRGRMPRVG